MKLVHLILEMDVNQMINEYLEGMYLDEMKELFEAVYLKRPYIYVTKDTNRYVFDSVVVLKIIEKEYPKIKENWEGYTTEMILEYINDLHDSGQLDFAWKGTVNLHQLYVGKPIEKILFYFFDKYVEGKIPPIFGKSAENYKSSDFYIHFEPLLKKVFK